MKKCKIFLILLVAVVPILSFAQNTDGVEKFEMSFQIGAGFTWANKAPMDGVERLPDFAWSSKVGNSFPAFEAYGAVLRYSIDDRWAVQLQGMRQRLRFSEKYMENEEKQSHYYYNAAWHVDAMAEYNLVRYAFLSNQQNKVYEFVPYIAFGAGASMYGANATYAYGNGWGIVDGHEKMICFNNGVTNKKGEPSGKYKYPKIEDTKAAMYIPFAVGAKLRMTANWQLKIACQYNFYLFGSDSKVDMYGSTKRPNPEATYNFKAGETGYLSDTDTKHYYVTSDLVDYVKYEDMPKYKSSGFGKNHNLMLTLGIIFNFNPKYRDMIIE